MKLLLAIAALTVLMVVVYAIVTSPEVIEMIKHAGQCSNPLLGCR